MKAFALEKGITMKTATLPADQDRSAKKRPTRAPTKRTTTPKAATRKPRPHHVGPTFKAGTPEPLPVPQPVAGPTPPPSEAPPGPAHPPERQAKLVERAVVPAAMASALGLDGQISAAGYRLFLDGLLRDAGNPSDPVAVMLLEQMVICHLRSVQLQAHAGEAKGFEAIELYASASARLMAEFRKSALAWKAYRNG
jgi:hypothetical protein